MIQISLRPEMLCHKIFRDHTSQADRILLIMLQDALLQRGCALCFYTKAYSWSLHELFRKSEVGVSLFLALGQTSVSRIGSMPIYFL